MWQKAIAAGVVVPMASSCAPSGDKDPSTKPANCTPAIAPAVEKAPTVIETFFDPVTARALMAARADYDAAEAAALAQSEKIIGTYRNVMMASRLSDLNLRERIRAGRRSQSSNRSGRTYGVAD